MSAREEILAAVRAAHAGEVRPDLEVPRNYRSTGGPVDGPDDVEGMMELFAGRVRDYRAGLTRCTPAGLHRAVIDVLDGAAPVLVPDGLGQDLGLDVDLDLPDATDGHGLSHAELDTVAAVVTTATVAIAATGTIVLTHGPGQGRRAVSLVPDLHVCIVTTDRIVPDVPDAIARLDAAHPQTWISGPSATSDIELNRVEGVHGPRTLRVVLVGAHTDTAPGSEPG